MVNVKREENVDDAETTDVKKGKVKGENIEFRHGNKI